ncbi:MAG: metallophosphoesterase [Betaproteobacteria bacterium]|nr:metallophosphoesterase [Betaproteobacteria bacterium]
MRLALLADIHSNLEALGACLAHARRQGVDGYALLGDLLGYNADPLACLDIVAELADHGAVVLAGNHDVACLGGLCENMSFHAREAIYWTRAQLGAPQRGFLAGLPLTAAHGLATLAHASPDQPDRWQYISGGSTARRAFDACATPLVFVGHVHHTLLYFTSANGEPRSFQPVPGTPVPLSALRRWLLIVGAVGQPRDGLSAACYAIHDGGAGTLTSYRVPYDCAAAARKVRAAGLPERLALRLEAGR